MTLIAFQKFRCRQLTRGLAILRDLGKPRDIASLFAAGKSTCTPSHRRATERVQRDWKKNEWGAFQDLEVPKLIKAKLRQAKQHNPT